MKFVDLQKKIPIRKSETIEGLYMRGVSISTVDDFNAKESISDKEILFWCFENIFCDEDGNPFEDIQTVDDVDTVEMDVAVAMLKESHKILGSAGNESAADQSDN